MADHPTPTLLTPKALAARWQVSKSLVYDLAKRGHLPHVQIAGCIRLRPEDVEAYEQAGYVAAPVVPVRLRGRLRPA
jgi:excisionase family DNA binding protein